MKIHEYQAKAILARYGVDHAALARLLTPRKKRGRLHSA